MPDQGLMLDAWRMTRSQLEDLAYAAAFAESDTRR
jgi:hypothetical protein